MPDNSKRFRESVYETSAEIILGIDPSTEIVYGPLNRGDGSSDNTILVSCQVAGNTIAVYVPGYLMGREDMNTVWCFEVDPDLVTGAKKQTQLLNASGGECAYSLALPGMYLPCDTPESRNQEFTMMRLARCAGKTVVSTDCGIAIDGQTIYEKNCTVVGDIMAFSSEDGSRIDRIQAVRDDTLLEFKRCDGGASQWACQVVQTGVDPAGYKIWGAPRGRLAPSPNHSNDVIIDGVEYTFEGVHHYAEGDIGRYVLRIIKEE